MKRTFLAAKKLLLVVLLLSHSFGALAGIPVIDGANLTQNVIDAIEAVTQTAQQLNQYQMQMDQYQNQLQNTKNLASFQWNDAQSTMTNLQNLTDTLNSYKQKLGTINGYLDKYKELTDYEGNTCFTALGCTEADKTALKQNQQFQSEAQKNANDAVVKGLDQQQSNIASDSRALSNLQTRAQAADGQVEALQYSNQFAGQQNAQLLQIRSLLVSQNNAAVTQMAAQNDKEAQQTAASKQLRLGSYKASTNKEW